MIKTNCELPLCMMGQNRDLNDFDFVLFHLYSKSKEYRDYYRNNRGSRKMILDCSAYEYFVMGEKLPAAAFARAVRELKPDYYICPDTLMDQKKTLDDTIEFLSTYKSEIGSEPMAVAQGDEPEELVHCLMQYYKLGIKAVALPFHNSFFYRYGGHDQQEFIAFSPYKVKWNEDTAYAAGRMKFVKDIEYILKEFDYVHLLGSHCVIEKAYYDDEVIDSMDTGYPVKCAIAGYNLFSEPEKPNVIIDDFLNDELSDDTKQLIIKNIKTFKEL